MRHPYNEWCLPAMGTAPRRWSRTVLIVIPVVYAEFTFRCDAPFGICNNPVPPKSDCDEPSGPDRLILQHDRHWRRQWPGSLKIRVLLHQSGTRCVKTDTICHLNQHIFRAVHAQKSPTKAAARRWFHMSFIPQGNRGDDSSPSGVITITLFLSAPARRGYLADNR